MIAKWPFIGTIFDTPDDRKMLKLRESWLFHGQYTIINRSLNKKSFAIDWSQVRLWQDQDLSLAVRCLGRVVEVDNHGKRLSTGTYVYVGVSVNGGFNWDTFGGFLR